MFKLLMSLLFICGPVFSKNLPERLDKTWAQKGLKRGEWSLAVGGANPWSKNGTQLLIPASVTKLVTTAWVMENFPRTQKLVTNLKAQGVEGNQLKGPLYFVGAGDPSFVSENMWVLVNNFLRSGISEITEGIVVDESLFDDIRFDSTRDSVRVDRAFDAPISALSFNWNSVNIYARPTFADQPAKVFLDPENEYLNLDAKVITRRDTKNTVSAERNGKTIVVRGEIPESDPEKAIYKNIDEPALWAGFNLKSFLQKRGIKVTGAIRKGVAPNDSIILASSESKALDSMIVDMNKFSNNFVAEMLTKLVASKTEKPATLKTGIQSLNNYIVSMCKNCLIQSPSGFSRKNRLSAQTMVDLLVKVSDSSSMYPEFAASLPLSGLDGTLKKRFKNSDAKGEIRAKTGYLDGVVGLAGYAKGIPFAFLYNGPEDGGRVRAVFDKLAEEITE